MKKRKFLQVIPLLKLCFISKYTFASESEFQDNNLLDKNILTIFGELEDVCRMGEDLAEMQLPNFSSMSYMEIFDELPLNLKNNIRNEIDIRKIRSVIRHSIQNDFIEGNIVKVEGFVLSKCEVNICMLVTSMCKSRGVA